MKDIFRGYHRNKILTHVGVFLLSLICALGIQLLFTDGDISHRLQANIVWGKMIAHTDIEKKEGLRAELRDNFIDIVLYESLSHMESISLSLVYDPSTIEIWDNIVENLLFVSTEAWIATLQYTLSENLSVKSGEVLFSLPLLRKNDSPTVINLYNASYIDHTSTNNTLSTRPLAL